MKAYSRIQLFLIFANSFFLAKKPAWHSGIRRIFEVRQTQDWIPSLPPNLSTYFKLNLLSPDFSAVKWYLKQTQKDIWPFELIHEKHTNGTSWTGTIILLLDDSVSFSAYAGFPVNGIWTPVLLWRILLLIFTCECHNNNQKLPSGMSDCLGHIWALPLAMRPYETS